MSKVKEYIEFNPTERLSKGLIAKKIAMDKIQPYCRQVSGFELEEYKGGTKFRNGDTVMARITPCLENGKTAKITILDDGEVAFGSTEFIVMRAKPGICDPDFTYYLSISPKFREAAIKSMTGSSGRQRVQQNVIEDYEYEFPSLEAQQRIAAILSSLDDKIELNNEINRNLEQQSRLIFADAFLSHEGIPAGWQKSNLLEIADYLNGLAMQKYRPKDGEVGLPVLKIRELRQGLCDSSCELCSPSISEEYIIHDGDVIFSWSGSLLVDLWCGGDCGLNQHLFKVTSSKYDKWFYYAWTSHYLSRFAAIAADKATTMGHIKRDDLKKAEVLIPSKQDYHKIGALLEPIYDSVINNKMQNRELAALRDALLPRLMSGELDVSDVEI